MFLYLFFFFFSSRRRHTRCLSDWSSDVCSSDLSRPCSASRRPREKFFIETPPRKKSSLMNFWPCGHATGHNGSRGTPRGHPVMRFKALVCWLFLPEIGRASCRERLESGQRACHE